MGRIATLLVALGLAAACGGEPQQQWRQVLGSGEAEGGNQLGSGSGSGGNTLGTGSGPGGNTLGTGSGSGGNQLGTGTGTGGNQLGTGSGGGGGGPVTPPTDGGTPPTDGGTRQPTCPDVCDYLIECGATSDRAACITACEANTTPAQRQCAAAAPDCATLNGCFGA